MKKPLAGLTKQQQEQIEHAVDFIVDSVYADLSEALGGRMDNESLMETVADHLYDYPALYGSASYSPVLDADTHKTWLALDWALRRKWLVKEFQYA